VASGAATAVNVNATVLELTVPKLNIGSPALGAKADSFFITSKGTAITSPGSVLYDNAPDTGTAATNYTFMFGAGSVCATCVPGDTDGDGLNDTFENQYFGNLNQTGSGDADSDGLNNTQEQTLGTDPSKADTDGDGYNDGAEVAAGTNPKDPASHPGGTPSSTSSSSTSGSSSSSSGGGGGTTGTSSTSKSLTDKLTADPQYLGIAGGGALLVIVLCLVGRFGRWGL